MARELEDRVVRFVGNLIAGLPKSKSYAVEVLTKQLIRSSVSVALNYAEATEAETRRDFIHKMKISLKELKETQINLRIISAIKSDFDCNSHMNECSQLIAIFIASIRTARKS